MSAEQVIPTVSVVIPVKNEGAKIKACIDGILSQTIPVEQIIVVDSGSTDRTLDILAGYDKVKVIEIPSEEFNHGLTRNRGVEEVNSEYCLLTVGDARPTDDQWIEKLLKAFENQEVAGVCGQQVVPHEPDNNPVEWFRPFSQPQIVLYSFTADEFERLQPDYKKSVCSWDDVTAMYRTEVLRDIPFRKTTYAEDALWARDAVLAGYTIAYNRAARVYHYHKADPAFTFAKSFTVFYYIYKFFGVIPEVESWDLKKYITVARCILRDKSSSLSDKIYWWKYNIQLRKDVNRAVIKFRDLLDSSESALDDFHAEEFAKPPIPLKSVK